MAVLECPLCCAENFPDEVSLQDHLFSLSDNIVCPACELQFKTILNLAIHLGGECRHSKEALKNESPMLEEHTSDVSADPIAHFNQTVELGGQTTSQSCDETFSTPNLNNQIQDFESLKLLEDNIDTRGERIEDDAHGNGSDIDTSLVTFLNTNGLPDAEAISDEDKLYSCSVCNITFASIEAHLKDYHQDEYVFVDNNVSEDYQLLLKNGAESVAESDADKGGSSDSLVGNCPSDGDYMLSDSASIAWPQDDFKNMMLGNWAVDDTLQNQNSRVFNGKHGYVLMPSSERLEHGQWVDTAEGFFYAPNEKKAQELRLRINDEKTALESAVRTITEEENGLNELSNYSSLWDDWPHEIKALPLATFVCEDCDLINVGGEGNELSCTIEKKPYSYRDHKVRLVRVRGGNGRLPSLEDIPFPEKPPDGLFPVLEPAVNAPDDLVGTLGVMWPCQFCGHLELHWSTLAAHKCTPSENDKFPEHKCNICSKFFQHKRQLINHFNLAHRGSQHAPTTKIQCEICSAKVHTSSHLEKHMAMHRKNDLVKCEECQCMVQKSTYEEHVKAHAKNGKLSLVCFLSSIVLNQFSANRHPQQCYLGRGVMANTLPKPVQTNKLRARDHRPRLCNRPFKGEAELEHHIPQCHLQGQESSELQCVVCQKVYLDIPTLREHLVTHNIPIRNHCCQYCPKSFNRLIDKVVHERVHTKSKPHECRECGRCFRLRNSLMTHLRIHTGERPFSCSTCTKSFRTKHLLRIHSTTHSQNMQFKCSLCPKVFKCRERARIHENLHKKLYSCQDCGRTFHTMGFMRKHAENHEKGTLIYKCNICPHMFMRAAYLESHLVNDHGLDSATSIKISCKETFEHMNMKANLAEMNSVSKLQ